MAGIRVHIADSLLDRHATNDLREKLKAHFEDRRQGGNEIKEIHFPLLQNEAVIIYEHSSVVDRVMGIEHTIDGLKLCVRKLPQCQIYQQLHADLEPDMASIIQGCGFIDTLEHEIKVKMYYDKKKKTITGFFGSWYQMEMAWNFIDSLMAQQKRMLLDNKLKELSYNRNIYGKERYGRSTGLPSSDEDGNLSELLLPLDHEPRRIQQREEHRNNQEDLNCLSVESEQRAEKSSARQRKNEQKSLSDHATEVDKAPCIDSILDEYTSQKHENKKKKEMVTEHVAQEKLLLGEKDIKSDHLNTSCVRKEDISKSSICQAETDPVSAQMQRKVKYDILSDLPRYENLNVKQEKRLDSGKNFQDEFYSMQTKQHLLDVMADTDGTPSQELHGRGFAVMDHSLASGVERTARQRDDTKNETFEYFASMKDESSVTKESVQNGDGVTNSRSVPNKDNSLEHDEDNFVCQPYQSEDSVNCFSVNLRIPQLEFKIGDISVVVLKGDITREKSDGIVSVASTSLDNGTGIAKTIAMASGRELQKECRNYIKKHQSLGITEVMCTSAGGHLNSKVCHVLHAVGPVWNEKLSSDEIFQDELTTTYVNCFQLSEKIWLHSLSLPLISSGLFGGPIHLCVRSFIDGLLIFMENLGKKPNLQEIRLINIDLEGTQLTIVILQQLLEMGLKKLTKEALRHCDRKAAKTTTTTKLKRSSSLPRSYKRESNVTANDGDKEGKSMFPSRGRSSSISKKTDSNKVQEIHLSQITSSTSTQMKSSSTAHKASGRSVKDQDGHGSYSTIDIDCQPLSNDRPFSAGPILNNEKSTGSSSMRTRPTSSTGMTLEQCAIDQHDNRSSFPTRTCRDSQSTSGDRPSSTGPFLKSQKTTSSTRSHTGPLDGGSVGQTKSPPQIKQSLFSQEPSASKQKERGHLSKKSATKAKLKPLKAVHDSQDSDINMESPRSPSGDNSDDSLGSPRDASSEKMFARRDLKQPEHMFSSLPLDLEKPSHKLNSRMAAALPLGLSQRHMVERDMDTVCPICLEKMHRPKTLPKCNHKFCSACIEKYFKKYKPVCPQCGYVYGVIKGDQPRGKMSYKVDKDLTLPGYEDTEGAIIITYDMPGGKQENHHPKPGQIFYGAVRIAYLPNCSEGRLVLRLLERAFDAGLIFTIGESKTTGRDNMVTWNDIHHKTSIYGGSTNFGYPDPTYLHRVQEELAAKGITRDMVLK